ncbi:MULTISPECIES: flagellar basal-body MS-ring/collar protein FliF [Microbulbifer]|uniref:flagellar basal-body MS-ring/collar protein FliF n=1 Tax=Microbulbifer TaxID=48073 RepID=UPI001E56A13D|nr:MULTISPECIES: flagellar basal-body MS-ring/collar protein FliF [Microbulbifer]UHQ56896.1 flagellar M-ring protein FliF [Microbulbifer sp. YPW16]
MKFLEGKPLLFGGIALIVVFLVVASYWILSSGEEVLFRELAPEEVDKVSAELSVRSIEHSIDRAQGTISVAKADLSRAKETVMNSGNAFREIIGFELFNESDFGITDFAQRVNYQRALEGELSRTIGSLDDIRHARVHLVLPEKKLFSEDEEKVSASITVYLDPGKEISASQVAGIKKLVESSVPKILPQDISIVDQSGRVLEGGVSSGDGVVGGQLREKIRTEKYLQGKLSNILDGSLGPSSYVAHVDVSLVMNNRTVQTERLISPGDGAGIKKIRETESRGAGEDQGSRDKSREVSYEYGREISNTEYAGYDIARVSVGVVIDTGLEGVKTDDVRDLVSSVLGMKPDRGDTVTVIRNNIALKKAFDKYNQQPLPEAPEQDRPEPSLAVPSQYILIAIALLLGLGAILMAGRMITERSRVRRVSRQLQQWAELPSNVVEYSDR